MHDCWQDEHEEAVDGGDTEKFPGCNDDCRLMRIQSTSLIGQKVWQLQSGKCLTIACLVHDGSHLSGQLAMQSEV
uniref:Uncharacterized protein n=1 Tax=Pristionchus pacificus TaxID=54126 RepID=A0A2A6D2L7_PRIPA|eukprot:PDM84674.1 hypothetical protein PRIPAC_33697 [Pristionchus pacificus]